MATTTPNFGWSVPTSTDLVKDGATAIETLGDSIDASLVDLKGGTTGQALIKASNTDMDFSWSSIDPLTILDAKGDLISATAADTPARLAVGANGTVLTADSAEATGLKWATPAAGGGMTSIASGSLSGTALSLTSISGSYKNLQLVLRNVQLSAAGTMTLRINNNSGAVYSQLVQFALANSFATIAEQNRTSFNPFYNNMAATTQSVLICNFTDYINTTSQKLMDAQLSYVKNGTTDRDSSFSICAIRDDAAITRIDVTASQTFSAGTYILYGVS